MLIEFHVKNFGPVKDTQTLSMLANSDTDLEDYYVHEIGNLRVLKLAVIYGPNASGKTTVLKALDFLRSLVLTPSIQKSEKLDFTPFLFDETSRNEVSWMRIVFIQDDIKFEYEIAFTHFAVMAEQLNYYPNGRQSVFFSRKTDLANEVSSINWGSKVKIKSRDKAILEGNTLWNESVLAAFNKSNIQSSELMSIQDWFQNYLQMMILPNTNMINWANKVQEKSTNDKSMMVDFLKKADVQIGNMEITVSEIPIDAKEIELIQIMIYLTQRKGWLLKLIIV